MDVNGVKETLQAYFDAGDEGSGANMKEVFYDIAHLYSLGEDGTIIDWDMEFFAKRVSSTDKGYPQYHEIISIEFISEYAAVARVKVRVMNTLFTDILSLICRDGKWKIIAKVFSGVPA